MKLRLLFPSLFAATALLVGCVDDTPAPTNGTQDSGGTPAKTPASQPSKAAAKAPASAAQATWVVYTYPG